MSNTLREFPMPFVIERTRELIRWAQSDECQQNFTEVYNNSRHPATTRANTGIEPLAPLTLYKGQRLNLRHQKNSPSSLNGIVTLKTGELIWRYSAQM